MFSIEKFLGLPWIVPAIVSLIIAGIYFFVWPSDKINEDTNIFIYFILRYGHSLTWVFLSTAAFLIFFQKESGVEMAKLLGFTGLIFYIFFILSFVLLKG